MHKHQTLIDKINSFSIQKKSFLLLVDFLQEDSSFFSIKELEKENIQLEFPTFKTPYTKKNSHEIRLHKNHISLEEYQAKFEVVQKHLHYGNSFLTNLTCETPIELNATLDDVFAKAKANYKLKFKNEWVCFSPETFIKIEQGMIDSFPMKGTIDADFPNALDVILNDKKELAEHYTIVDLIRNDLSKVAKNVAVKRFRYISEIKTSTKKLLQVSSHIQGELPTNYQSQLGEILFALLPAGSISGAPKTKTLEIIQEAEKYNRGFYTGVAFYFDGTNIDSCVLIRFIEKKGNRYVYKSGGGITIHSQVEKEYQELLDKIYVPTL